MLNRVVITGRLTKDPDLKVSQNNISVVNFTVAVNRSYKTENGPDADFINVVAFRKQAENVDKYLSKGSLCGVDGRLQSRTYDNKEGQKVFVTEVVADSVQFLEPKSQSGTNDQSSQRTQNNSAGEGYGGQSKKEKPNYEDNPFMNQDGPGEVSDDDLPF